MPKSRTSTPSGTGRVASSLATSQPKASSRRKHVAHAGHERPPGHPLPSAPASQGSTSSVLKYRKRPCAIRRSSSGRSASDTARYGLSSTS